MSKAKEYGYALYGLAEEEGLEKSVAEEFVEISGIFDSNRDLVKLLSNPRVPVQERLQVLDRIFQRKIHPYLLSLLKILTEKRDISWIPLCCKEYQNRYYEDKNILPVKAVSAVALNEDQRQRIIRKLEGLLGKTILLENVVDKSCIGGIRMEYHGHMIDASVKNRFQKLQLNLKNADYSQAEA